MKALSIRKYIVVCFLFNCLNVHLQTSAQCTSYNQSNPFNPFITGSTTISCGNSTTLTCSEINSKWYAQASGGSPISSANVLSVSPQSSTTYYVQREITLTQNQTFNYTGSTQTWVVPNGVTSISVTLMGAKGASGNSSGSSNGTGGLGGKVQATYPVTPGQTIYINVGGMPTCTGCGGWNGGGNGVVSGGSVGSGGGGGASDIRIGGSALNNRVLVAAGGGGGGCFCACCGNGNGGNGGGLVGSDSYYPFGSIYEFNYGHGGTQTNGGLGGSGITSTANGIMGQGGAGYNFGAGGGGGYFGGGGGIQDMGGGGGSSFASPSASNVTHTTGVNSGNGSVSISYQGVCSSSRFAVSVTVNSIQGPGNPTSDSPQCDIVTLTRTGTPPTGVTWYWQGTTSNGTSTTLGSGATFTTSASGTYYIRASNSAGCWSATSGSSIVTISSLPPSPGNPTSNSPQCSSVTISRSGAPAAGITWYWQGTNSNGTSITLGSSATFTTTSSGTYYLRARNNTSGCWSASSGSVSVTLSAPATPPNPTSNSPQCNSVTITRSGNPPVGETWYWQGALANGTTTSLGSGATYSVASNGTYYLRALNSLGCWSSLSGNVTVIVAGNPDVPPPPVSNSPQCGSVLVSRVGVVPAGETWNWQGTNPNGVSTVLGSGDTFQVTSTGTYYLRSRNSSNCWSTTSVGIPVTVLNASSSTQAVSSCNSYIAADGASYTSSGQYQTIIDNVLGCDSIINLSLIINPSYTVIDDVMACESFAWIDGNTYNSNNNTATFLLTTSEGCDSTITLNLIISQPTLDTTLVQSTAISSYTLNGYTYTENGIYYQTLMDIYGCDSTIALELMFDQSSLIDEDISFLKIYPNPSSDGLFYIQTEEFIEKIEINDLNGKTVINESFNGKIDLSELTQGCYIVRVSLENGNDFFEKIIFHR
jgi:hypothetical protein